jgi:hypothetical protein
VSTWYKDYMRIYNRKTVILIPVQFGLTKKDPPSLYECVKYSYWELGLSGTWFFLLKIGSFVIHNSWRRMKNFWCSPTLLNKSTSLKFCIFTYSYYVKREAGGCVGTRATVSLWPPVRMWASNFDNSLYVVEKQFSL